MSDETNNSANPPTDEDLIQELAGADNVVDINAKKGSIDNSKIDAFLGEIDPEFLKNLENLAQDVKDEVEKAKVEPPPSPPTEASVPSKFFFFKKIWDKPVLRYSVIGGVLALILPIIIYFASQQILNLFRLPYKPNLLEFAEEVITYPEDEEFVLLFDEYRKPFFNLTLPELTVTLATMPGGTQSYGQITIQLETSSQKKLDVLKTKEGLLLDVAQGVFERVTWHDLSTTNGKIQTKKNLVLTMNKALGGHFVSEVYYYSFFTKK